MGLGAMGSGFHVVIHGYLKMFSPARAALASWTCSASHNMEFQFTSTGSFVSLPCFSPACHSLDGFYGVLG